MSEIQLVVPFKPPTVDAQIQSIMEPLVACMREHDDSVTDESFRLQFVIPLRDAGPEAVISFLTRVKGEPPEGPIERRFAPMLMSVGFCVLAADAQDKTNADLAIALLMEAKYWCGAAVAGKGILRAYRRTKDEVIRRKQSKAGKGNNAVIRNEVIRAVTEETRGRPGLFTAAELAKTLRDHLVSFASKKKKLVFQGDKPEVAIKTMIKSIPETAKLVKKASAGRPPSKKLR